MREGGGALEKRERSPSASVLRPMATTRIPSRRHWRTNSRPIPPVAPVMTAVWRGGSVGFIEGQKLMLERTVEYQGRGDPRVVGRDALVALVEMERCGRTGTRCFVEAELSFMPGTGHLQ